jgi:hypothetical protein
MFVKPILLSLVAAATIVDYTYFVARSCPLTPCFSGIRFANETWRRRDGHTRLQYRRGLLPILDRGDDDGGLDHWPVGHACLD